MKLVNKGGEIGFQRGPYTMALSPASVEIVTRVHPYIVTFNTRQATDNI